ncbi:MAG: NEAT domain-containing protein, partial [Clostridiales Family XIII bacterium]|nr:NEAT domain-containing protein [Clostridiales Family XIII bacterium]
MKAGKLKAGRRITALCMVLALAVLAAPASALFSPASISAFGSPATIGAFGAFGSAAVGGGSATVMPDFATGAFPCAAVAFADDGGVQLDKDSLADGSYTLRADMIKINRKDYSMSNDAIEHDVRLAVSGGQYYLSVDFKGLSISLGGSSFFGYLARLKYYGAGFAYDKYGEPQGEKIPAEVLSYQLDSSGLPIVDQYNNASTPYPKSLRFPLVDKAGYADNDVPLQVFVPIMESIAAGNGT